MTLLKHLGAAPHRSLFLLGSVQLLATMVFWLAVLVLPMAPMPIWQAASAHAWTMLYGLLTPFVFGFLFTALPNWVNGRAIRRSEYLASVILIAAGSLLFYPAQMMAGLDRLALALHVAGWVVAQFALFRVLRTAPPGDNRQPWAVWVTLLLGLIGNAAFFGWRISGDDHLLVLGEALGLWGFLTPLFLAVCHRMVPYFTSRVVTNYVLIRPYPALWAMMGACFGHAALMTMGVVKWTWLTDLPLASISFWFIAVWGIQRSLHVRLLGMLHIAFVWAAIAFSLSGVNSLLQLFGQSGLGFAPLHALAIGFFGSMLIGMASRVSLGHSGRKLECDSLTWWLFLTIQLAAVIRMLPDLFPEWVDYRVASLAGLIWLFTFAVWAVRYAPIYWRPRADGKPG
jgi:uncharacterized protein involved in response to NO